MNSVIKLLPDSIANQIAAGEVIQRPASAVKELLENSIDAGSEDIILVLKDSGKSLIQISDNGKGMSETDARMCFERHATSKISNIHDLNRIKTKGFRGEALSSIAAVAQVELITNDDNSGLGTRILIEGSKFIKQEQVQSERGTKISLKNLFFNIPARRKFLKSDPVELKHCTNEFIRIALAHPEVTFAMFHNNSLLYQLPKNSLKQRILNVIGKSAEKLLLPVEQEMELFNINGYIGNIEHAQKSRNNQYLFVNNRFIKSNYLNHAINAAYQEFNSSYENPLYLLFIDIDPGKIDVNIHPTKQEIKFEEERLIYNYLKVAIKHTLGKFVLSPKLEFGKDSSFEKLGRQEVDENTDIMEMESGLKFKPSERQKEIKKNWQNSFDILKSTKIDSIIDNIGNDDFKPESESPKIELFEDIFTDKNLEIIEVFTKYLIYEKGDKIIVVNKKSAWERILFDKMISMIEKNDKRTYKQLIFPIDIDIKEPENVLYDEFILDLDKIGIICERVESSILLKEIPEFVDSTFIKELVENAISKYLNDIDYRYTFLESFSKDNAALQIKRKSVNLSKKEYPVFINELFACNNPLYSPSGEKCYYELSFEQLKKILV
ncbi:MAG: DNA mismatch repair endonuclease MutL [Saprospiraceae bacterium]